MNYALCVLDPSGQSAFETARTLYERLPRSRGLTNRWHRFSHVMVMMTVGNGSEPAPQLAVVDDAVGIGSVRLDNPDEVAGLGGLRRTGQSDLELVLRLVVHTGVRYVSHILGDFAFVAWSDTRKAAVIATDALGVKKLYYSRMGEALVLSSRAEALARTDSYNPQYLAELIADCTPTTGLTAFSDVLRVPAASVAYWQGGQLAPSSYWSPSAFNRVTHSAALERESPALCRHLLEESIRLRVVEGGRTWAQLSGGLDSSSIVSTAQSLAMRGQLGSGLGGTITYVDSQGTDADEREYSEAVAARWGVRNDTIVDPPFWIDPSSQVPQLDQPRESLAFHPKERRLCRIVTDAGGQVLLAGFGSDELLTGTALFFADWVARGHFVRAAREMTDWAVKGRVSFWKLAYGNALLPLVPAWLRRPRSVQQGQLLPWITRRASDSYGLRRRVPALMMSRGRAGNKYHAAVTSSIEAIATKLDSGFIGDHLDVRYPFLYRPFVEFALQLPAELCARPQARKWVLREAMRGTLPEKVRTRVGKGAPISVLVRSLRSQRAVLEPLLREPMLADLGVVDGARLRAAFEEAPTQVYQDHDLCTDVQTTLMVEAWLQVRAGRWPQGPSE